MKWLLHIPLGVPILIAAWFIVSWAGWSNPLVLPKPSLVLESLLSQLLLPSLWIDIGLTTFRAIIGLAISAVLGIPLGLTLGYFPRVYRHVSFPLDLIRSIP